MWTGPCAVFVPGGSGAELELMLTGSRVHTSPGHAGSLVGGERGYTRAKCEQRLLDRVGPKVLEQNSDGCVQTHSIPYKCALPHPDVCVSCSVMSDFATPWTIACPALLSMGFSRQEY